ncbi:aldo/keto reductase family oxidoreductase [Sphingobium sp. BS19]|uniref:aldo/keto reductase n=1 Tax=Sphingobium sp. BS19 TaxID=3018973 RepID=UPI0022EFB659|nr:aldo/keto reductase [Sphingobium sp. BS19]GLI97104.1 aryl-alcohol dehydrogenase [Sphingobium sp. BS19]
MPITASLPTPPVSRPLGQSGITVSGLSWGMWRFKGDDLAAARALVDAALDAGITLFDTADIYGPDNGEAFGASEALLGRVFAADKSLRSKIVLATKGGIVIGTPYDSSADYLNFAIDASLTRLGVDRVDLWQIHRPDILTHPQEMARTLEDAHKAGKIGAIGVSNFTVAQIDALAHFLTVPLATTQPEFSPLTLNPLVSGEFDQAMRMDMAIMAWSPLGGGKIANPLAERDRAVANALKKVADQYGVSVTAAAFSWIMAHPAHPIPIVGSQTPARIREAADAYKVTWTRADWYAVLTASREEPLP